MTADLNMFYAAYETDEEEAVYFKIIQAEQISLMMRALLSQHFFYSYEITKKEEMFRNGYITTGFKVLLTDVNHKKVSVPDLKRMMQEMALAMGHELRFISYNNLINLKFK